MTGDRTWDLASVFIFAQVDCGLDGIRIGDYCEQTYSVSFFLAVFRRKF